MSLQAFGEAFHFLRPAWLLALGSKDSPVVWTANRCHTQIIAHKEQLISAAECQPEQLKARVAEVCSSWTKEQR